MMKVSTCCCAHGCFDEDDGFVMMYDGQNSCQFSGIYTHTLNNDESFTIENLDIIIDKLIVEHDRLSFEFSKAENINEEIVSMNSIHNAATCIFNSVAAIYSVINGKANPYPHSSDHDEFGLRYLKHAIEELIDSRDALANVFEEKSHHKTSLTIIANSLENAVITLRGLPINKSIKECVDDIPTSKESIAKSLSRATASNNDVSATDCIKIIDTNIKELILERDSLSLEFSKAKGNIKGIISIDDINEAVKYIFNCIKIIDILLREFNGRTNPYPYYRDRGESRLEYIDYAIEDLLDGRNRLVDALKQVSKLPYLAVKYLDIIAVNIEKARITLRYRPMTKYVKDYINNPPTISNKDLLDKIYGHITEAFRLILEEYVVDKDDDIKALRNIVLFADRFYNIAKKHEARYYSLNK